MSLAVTAEERAQAAEARAVAAEAKAEEAKKNWTDHAARTTAVLAVLAALSSGQYAGQFSRTILAQAEASDKWSYYQAKSIKKHLTQNQVDMARAMAMGKPELSAQLAPLEEKSAAAAKKYDEELAAIKVEADRVEADKKKHQKQGDRFQYAFVVLQAGVVLSTIAASAKRRELWVIAILAGLAGLVMVLNGFLLFV